MSIRRVAAATGIIITVALSAPAAAADGINGADIICIVAPFAFLAVVWPRGRKAPAGGDTPPIVRTTPSAQPPAGHHPDAIPSDAIAHEQRMNDSARRFGMPR